MVVISTKTGNIRQINVINRNWKFTEKEIYTYTNQFASTETISHATSPY